jgi:NADP-dependent 3-hydroxy acid dehydrogenase YdfG
MTKHVLITGGSDGLGKITAEKLKAAGHNVTILSHSEEKTKAAAAELGCSYVVADVSDSEQVANAFAKAEGQNGSIDILINNAGVWLSGSLNQATPADIKRVIDVNTLGTIYCTQAVLRGMKQRKGGRIININSQAGIYAKAERTVYHASKWAVTGFTKALYQEVKPDGIAVVDFHPGAMATGLFSKANDMKDRSEALDPEIAAGALVYLCNLPDSVEVPEFGIESTSY